MTLGGDPSSTFSALNLTRRDCGDDHPKPFEPSSLMFHVSSDHSASLTRSKVIFELTRFVAVSVASSARSVAGTSG